MGATSAVSFGLNFWQALAVGLAAPVVSYGLVGLVGIAGKRGGAPGMTLPRAVFGRRGNLLPGSLPALVVTTFAISGLGISTVRTCSTWVTCLCGGSPCSSSAIWSLTWTGAGCSGSPPARHP